MPERYLSVVILGLYLFFGFGYSLLMPTWEAPDEQAHYGYVLRIARTGEAPTPDENHEAFQPPLYYWIASWPVRLLEAFRPGWVRLVSPGVLPAAEGLPRYDWSAENYVFLPGPLAVRWLGLVCGLVALLCIHRAVRIVFPDQPGLAAGTIALAAGIPQFIHITASVNNDVLAILAGALLFLALAEICRRESFSPAWFAPAAAALVVPVVTKLTVLPLALTVPAAVLVRARRLRPNRFAFHLLVITGAVLAAALLLLVFAPEAGARSMEELRFRLFTFQDNVWSDSFWRITGRYLWSFWGMVGWLSVGIPFPVAAGLTLLSLVGIGFGVRELSGRAGPRPLAPSGRRLLIFCLVALGFAALMILRNLLSSLQFQGRFLFPTLAPFALIVVFGWRRILAERSRYLAPAILTVMALLNLALWLFGVIPVYFQPFLDR